jgi:hypothetical protein
MSRLFGSRTLRTETPAQEAAGGGAVGRRGAAGAADERYQRHLEAAPADTAAGALLSRV